MSRYAVNYVCFGADCPVHVEQIRLGAAQLPDKAQMLLHIMLEPMHET